jgi:hypothetical protein
LTDDDAHPVDL